MAKNTTKYKYILFDWDGTLLNSIPTWIKGVREVLPKYNLSHLTDYEIVKNIISDLEHNRGNYPIPDLGVFKNEVYKTDAIINTHLSVLHDEAEELLKYLRNKSIPIGIATMSKRYVLENALAHHNLSHYFDTLITVDDVTNRKPHPEPIFKALEGMGADKPFTLYVGDTIHDTNAGRAAGVKTALYFPKISERYYDKSYSKDADADYILTALKELTEMV